MDDLVDEFSKTFLETIKELEEVAAHDADLIDVLEEMRKNVEQKRYVCAPNFWEDLKRSLQLIEDGREDRGQKSSKAQQVSKRLAKLEVKFWAKENKDMLQCMDPEFRTERLIDWVQSLDAGDMPPDADQSAGPVVLYTVLSDVKLQEDMEQAQKEQLAQAVRDNLDKFPLDARNVLERLAHFQSLAAGGSRGFGDWRRRAQAPTAGLLPGAEVLAAGLSKAGGTSESGTAATAPAGALAASAEAATAAAAAAAAAAAGAAAKTSAGTKAEGGGSLAPEANQETNEDASKSRQKRSAAMLDVDPKALKEALKAVLELLASQGGSCKKDAVAKLMKQSGLGSLPIPALGDQIAHSSSEVFLRERAPPTEPGAPPPPASSLGKDLRDQLVETIRSAGGRIPISQLAEKLRWQSGSPLHAKYGPLKKAVAQVPELFFEPKKVFTAEAFEAELAPPKQPRNKNKQQRQQQQLQQLQQQEEAENPSSTGADAMLIDQQSLLLEGGLAAAAPGVAAHFHVTDPFAELILLILAWLQQANGVLHSKVVLPLIKAMGFRTRAVIAGLARDVFWSHNDADCQVLLRTAAGASQHPNPLPENYLHKHVHLDILKRVKDMGSKTKADQLAGELRWGGRSELRRVYGPCRVVLMSLRELFFDPDRLHLKSSLSGIVEWPVSKEGRMGPPPPNTPLTAEEKEARHWHRGADDPKAQGDPRWLHARRQLLGIVMKSGGRCECYLLQQVLQQSLPEAQLDHFFRPGTPDDISSVLFWGRREIHLRRPSAIDPEAATPSAEDYGLPPGAESLILLQVRSSGRRGTTLEALREVLEQASGSGGNTGNSAGAGSAAIPDVSEADGVKAAQEALQDKTAEGDRPNAAAPAGVDAGAEAEAEAADAPAAATAAASAATAAAGATAAAPAAPAAATAAPAADADADAPEAAAAAAAAATTAGGDVATAAALLPGSSSSREGIDEGKLCLFLQQVPELFYVPQMVCFRHLLETAVFLPEEANEAGVPPAQEELEAAATSAPLKLEGADTAPPRTAQQAALKGGDTSLLLEEAKAARKRPGKDDGSLEDSQPSGKRQKSAGSGSLASMAAATAAGTVPAWGGAATSWLSEGAAVMVRSLQALSESSDTDSGGQELEATIIRTTGSSCTVRSRNPTSGDILEYDVPLPNLVPIAPKVGSSVKVVAGDRKGCIGELVGLAKNNGVVQINRMSYETLPMSCLVALGGLLTE